MDMNEFLKKHKFINKTQLAIRMWYVPNEKDKINTAKVNLIQKIGETNKQHMLPEDYEQAYRVFDEFNSDLKKLIKSNPRKKQNPQP